jgi:hypothetical protein
MTKLKGKFKSKKARFISPVVKNRQKILEETENLLSNVN